MEKFGAPGFEMGNRSDATGFALLSLALCCCGAPSAATAPAAPPGPVCELPGCGRAEVPKRRHARPPSSCSAVPTGAILDRWTAIGADQGPLGCPLGAAQSATDGSTIQNFRSGQIRTAPVLGPNAAVALYQQGSDLAVDWGDTSPNALDAVVVRWSVDGVLAEPRTIASGLRNGGVWMFPRPQAGSYSVTVGGCTARVPIDAGECAPAPTSGPWSGSCPAAWTGPVTHRFVADALPVPATTVQCTAKFDTIGDAIGVRWADLQESLGCPTGPQVRVPGTDAIRQNFGHGQMVASPDQGTKLVVSLFQQGNALVLDWASTEPRSYDKFLVRNASTGGQFDDAVGSPQTSGHVEVVSNPTPGLAYSFIVEGCRSRPLAPAACDAGWTTPVTWTFSESPPQAPTRPAPALLDFSAIAPVTSAAHAADQLAERGRIVAEYWGCNKDIEGSVTGDEQDWMSGALGRLDMLARGVGGCPGNPSSDYRAELNRSLAKQVAGSDVGSTLKIIPNKCWRSGEYDVALTGYVRMLEQYPRFLDDEVQARIESELLNQTGPFDCKQEVACKLPFISIQETENHLNGIESARYLANQIRYAETGAAAYDNEANGMNRWWLKRLQGYLLEDFVEYNSKNYQPYTDNAIQNLFDFAKDRRVKAAARLVLDFIAAKWAVSSRDLRRSAPYRRRASDYSTFLLDDRMEGQPGRFLLWTGATGILADPDFKGRQAPFVVTAAGWAGNALDADVTGYRPPEAIVDLLLNPAARTYFERIRHYGVEIYASRPGYLIAAGGVYVGPVQDPLGLFPDNAGVAVPTVLMPDAQLVDTDNMIRFDGVGDFDGIRDVSDARRVNTCVGPDFACGLNLRIPARYKASASCYFDLPGKNGGDWTFLDFAHPGCNPRSTGTAPAADGFYVAAWVGPKQGKADNFGFFEVHPADPSLSFAAFEQGVLQRNATTTFATGAPNPYVMTSRATISFVVPGERDIGQDPLAWPFATLGDVRLDATGSDIARWPLASGEVLSSEGHTGLVRFRNPATGARIVLDFRNVGEP